jgi:hypothetical protein
LRGAWPGAFDLTFFLSTKVAEKGEGVGC